MDLVLQRSSVDVLECQVLDFCEGGGCGDRGQGPSVCMQRSGSRKRREELVGNLWDGTLAVSERTGVGPVERGGKGPRSGISLTCLEILSVNSTLAVQQRKKDASWPMRIAGLAPFWPGWQTLTLPLTPALPSLPDCTLTRLVTHSSHTSCTSCLPACLPDSACSLGSCRTRCSHLHLDTRLLCGAHHKGRPPSGVGLSLISGFSVPPLL